MQGQSHAGLPHHADLSPERTNSQVWGILREGEAARQFIEGGEYYVLKKVPYITKVGDVLELEEAGSGPALAK